MSELGIFSTFNNSELDCSITTLKVGDDIWFIGSEFATSLEYANPQKAIRDHVDESDKFYFQDLDTGDCNPGELPGSNPRGVNESFTPLKIQPHSVVISEAGAYCLIMRSKLPAAKEFTKWVTKEVIPTIRKTGTYTIPEGALPKLRDINNNEICELKGKEKKEFRCESKHKSELTKNEIFSASGHRGGTTTQNRWRKLKTEHEKLKVENTNLKEQVNVLEKDVDELSDQVEELTNELDAIKSGIAEILADDY